MAKAFCLVLLVGIVATCFVQTRESRTREVATKGDDDLLDGLYNPIPKYLGSGSSLLESVADTVQCKLVRYVYNGSTIYRTPINGFWFNFTFSLVRVEPKLVPLLPGCPTASDCFLINNWSIPHYHADTHCTRRLEDTASSPGFSVSAWSRVYVRILE